MTTSLTHFLSPLTKPRVTPPSLTSGAAGAKVVSPPRDPHQGDGHVCQLLWAAYATSGWLPFTHTPFPHIHSGQNLASQPMSLHLGTWGKFGSWDIFLHLTRNTHTHTYTLHLLQEPKMQLPLICN